MATSLAIFEAWDFQKLAASAFVAVWYASIEIASQSFAISGTVTQTRLNRCLSRAPTIPFQGSPPIL